MAKLVICDLLKIFKYSVSAVLPENLIRRSVKYNPVSEQLTICEHNYNLQARDVFLVGTGKAVGNMAVEIEKILGSKIKQGIISIPEGSLKTRSKIITYCEGAKNNLPDKNAEDTSRKVTDLVKSLTEKDLLIVLVSGGGSALLALPKPPISLEDKKDLIKKLANTGADIKELNTVRKKLSDIKGGKLAMNAYPATVVSLILSDIVGDPIDLIASGPTVENEDKPSKAMDIINKYNLFDTLPESIKTVLKENEEPKSFPKDRVLNHVIGSNKLSLAAIVDEAKQLNYIPMKLSHAVTGNVINIAEEYAKLTDYFCAFLKGNMKFDDLKSNVLSLSIPDITLDVADTNNIYNKDVCLILGGEITVEVKGKGKGGRNQQLALEYSKNIHNFKDKLKGFDVYFLSAGTDGIDGPTDAAGAIGYLDLISEAEQQKFDTEKYLNENDSYNFYKDFDGGKLHVVTGHTGTNVMDIHLILIKYKSQLNHYNTQS
ncbi:MOFRL family domain-containing protein [Phthorimaea operculella]|nr:MOFRL family domain-containing protein [Phthorimaea operculella]